MVMSGQTGVWTLPQATKGTKHKITNMTLSLIHTNEYNIINCKKLTNKTLKIFHSFLIEGEELDIIIITSDKRKS